jgi:glucose/arabinose dehydrogenase
MKIKLLLLLLFYSNISLAAKAIQVFEGDEVIWGFDFINQEEVLFTQREGSLFHLDLKTKKTTKLEAPIVEASGQGGLLDILIDNGHVYLTYSKKNKDVTTTALAKADLVKSKLRNLRTIFEATVKSNTTRHFGSRLVIKDNHLFMTIGDRGEREHSQDLSLHNGSILKLTKEGKPASDNPFIGKESALPEIWSYGHRNPQGIDMDPVSGELYSCEFGPRGGDELNRVRKGLNYGWPVITYGKEYWGPKIGTTHKEGMEQPIKYWDPSISPSGMVFYRGDKIKEWKNNLFLANLSSTHLRRLVLKNEEVVEEEPLFADMDERIRQVRNGPDGHLYFSTDSGKIFRVTR